MADFPHLQFLSTVPGYLKNKPRPIPPGAATQENLKDMPGHGQKLKTQLDAVRQDWELLANTSQELGLAVGSADNVPLFLQVDPELFKLDQLKTWGIEIIAEEEDGYVIASSFTGNMHKLVDRLAQMISAQSGGLLGVNGIAGLLSIAPKAQGIGRIVSDTLLARWDRIDNEECLVDVSINIGMSMPAKCPVDATTRQRNAWHKQVMAYESISDARQDKLREIVESNDGSLESGFVAIADSSTCRIRIWGAGLKLLALVDFVWKIEECDEAAELRAREDIQYFEYNPELIAPARDAAKVCVIDSGIQLNHRLLEPAIASSKSYVPNDPDESDSVRGGGHGTRVAGAVLYPHAIPRTGAYQLITWLQNARILSGPRGNLHAKLFPPALMREIVADHLPTRIYNLSVQTPRPCRRVHMSTWAATIDQLSFEYDVLFVVCAGNLDEDIDEPTRIGLKQHLLTSDYPDYLAQDSCRIGNPAQSCQALTVGSVCYDKIDTDTHQSFGDKDWPSAFSRTGLGMWQMVKPDVVEYGGDNVRTTIGTLVMSVPEACPELVSSLLSSNKAVSRDAIGTSYAAPKVAHIAAALQNLFPNSRTLLYRALIAQSAHWPDFAESDSNDKKLFHFRTLGYGIPSLERATENDAARITFITEDFTTAKSARLYAVKIPGIGSPGDSSQYRIDVTLSYAARPRRTRRYLRSYLSTHLQWEMAKLGESVEAFKSRIRFTLQSNGTPEEGIRDATGVTGLPWQLGKYRNHNVEGVRIQDGTLQKDWAFVQGHQFTRDYLLFAVTGHQGWEKKPEQIPFALTVTLTSLEGKEIYEVIRTANIRIDNQLEQEIGGFVI